MRRFLLSLAVGLSVLALTGTAQADEYDGYKEYLKRLKEQQKRQDEFLREQQKRYEEQRREQAKREAEFYREHAKRQAEYQREQAKREWEDRNGKHRLFGHGDYYPGQNSYLPSGYPAWPGRFSPSHGQRPLVPYRGQPYLSGGDLGRHIERAIKGHLGHVVKDIDVDVDSRRGRIKVEAEVRHPFARTHLERLLYSMPELAGYGIRLDVEVDD